MKEIKACPFCGSNEFFTDLINVKTASEIDSIRPCVMSIKNAPPEIRICCKKCYATMIQRFENPDIFNRIEQINATIDKLIDRWNTRHHDVETQLKAERLNRLAEWENELDNKADDLKERESEIIEKVRKYQAIRDEMSVLLQNIDNQNNEIYKRIDDLLKSTEETDAPLEMLNLTLSTIKNNKNNN